MEFRGTLDDLTEKMLRVRVKMYNKLSLVEDSNSSK